MLNSQQSTVNSARKAGDRGRQCLPLQAEIKEPGGVDLLTAIAPRVNWALSIDLSEGEQKQKQREFWWWKEK